MSDQLSPAPSRSDLPGLIARARAVDGAAPFSDGALVQLEHGTATLVWLEDAAAIVTAGSAEFVVDPDARRRGLGTRMLELLSSQTTGEMLFWAHGDHPGSRALAASHGLTAVRELLQLEASVPAPRAAAPAPAAAPAAECSASVVGATGGAAEAEHSRAVDLELGPIRLPEEAAAWLELNARAFAGHPEQGRMTRADLDITIAAPWFNADDFLLLRDGAAEGAADSAADSAADGGTDRGTDRSTGGRTIVGFCWLKVEALGAGPDEPLEGEFYVVGVDPRRQGERLGRRLVEAGLARLASRGIHSAHLFVEGDNAAALSLYRRYGFTNRSVDIQYRTTSPS